MFKVRQVNTDVGILVEEVDLPLLNITVRHGDELVLSGMALSPDKEFVDLKCQVMRIGDKFLDVWDNDGAGNEPDVRFPLGDISKIEVTKRNWNNPEPGQTELSFPTRFEARI